MRKQPVLIVILGALLLSNLPAAARDFNLPPGKWWENERVVRYLELTPEQQSSIKELVYRHATRMIDLNAGLEKAQLALENEVGKNTLDPQGARDSFTVFQEARRRLESERFEMMLSVRQMMNLEQWEKLLSLRERIEQNRRRPDGPRVPRNPPGMPGGPRR